MTRTKLTILLALFALSTTFSILGVYFSHQTPIEQYKVISLLTYHHNGRYDYTAQLKPNILYNQTTLKPGEGILYTKITELVNITFTYSFNCCLPSNVTLQYSINQRLKSPKWPEKTIVASPLTVSTLLKTTTAQFSITQSINITALDELKNSIDKETGTYTSEYSLIVQPHIDVVANTTAGTINELFTPNMTMNFRYRTPEGDYIAIEGLTHTQQGNIQQTETIYQPEVMSQRYMSYAFSIVFISALLCTTWAYLKAKPEKPTKPEKPIEEIIAPHEEIIFETAEEPSYERLGRTVIKMKSLEALVSIADGLAKPVLYLKKPPTHPGEEPIHVFYVLDGSVIYEYETAAPSRAEREEERKSV